LPLVAESKQRKIRLSVAADGKSTYMMYSDDHDEDEGNDFDDDDDDKYHDK